MPMPKALVYNVVCPKCGWTYDYRSGVRTCIICGHKVVRFYKERCKPDRSPFADEWMRHVMVIPDTYPRLTDEQWIEACIYFNTCARCKQGEIEARDYFVPFVSGGRYCDWNIIPVCGSCVAGKPRLISPLHGTGLYTWGNGIASINNVIQFLKPKLLKASGEEWKNLTSKID